jgi:hypothetical protein
MMNGRDAEVGGVHSSFIIGRRGRAFAPAIRSRPRRRADSSPPAWVQVVMQLLNRVKGDPDSYAAQIAEVQEHYGDTLVRRDKVEKVRMLVADLQQELAE